MFNRLLKPAPKKQDIHDVLRKIGDVSQKIRDKAEETAHNCRVNGFVLDGLKSEPPKH